MSSMRFCELTKLSLKSPEKIKIESHSMDIIKKQKKAEKRQGWWNQ